MEGKKKTELALNEEAVHRLRLFEESLNELIKLTEPDGGIYSVSFRNGTEFIYTTLTEDVCRKCPKYRECFGEKREKTLTEISAILEKAGRETRVDGRMASGEFRKQCVYFQPFMEEMSWLFRILYQNRCWEKRMADLRQLMHKQMLSQSLLMQECRRMLSEGTMIRGGKKRKLRRALFLQGVRFLEGQEYVDETGLLNLNLLVQPLSGSRKSRNLALCISSIYDKKFQCSRMDAWLRPGKNRLSFVEEGGFQVLFGKKHCNKEGESVCGDTFSFGNYNKKRAVMLLSDGMGAGENAYADSRKLIETFEAMLEAGIHEEYALEIIHSALLSQNKTKFSTLDAAVISLQTGMLKTLKAGGAATFIRHGRTVERIIPKSLPLGCLADQQFDLCRKKLYDGDMVIMISDGMLGFEQLPDNPYSMETILESIKTSNAQLFAEQLMETVPVPEGGHDDDRTVLVAAVWERGRMRR